MCAKCSCLLRFLRRRRQTLTREQSIWSPPVIETGCDDPILSPELADNAEARIGPVALHDHLFEEWSERPHNPRSAGTRLEGVHTRPTPPAAPPPYWGPE